MNNMKAKDLIKELQKNPEAELFILTEHMGMPYPRRLGETCSNGTMILLADDTQKLCHDDGQGIEQYLEECEDD